MVENKFEFLQYVKSYDFYMKPPGKKKKGGHINYFLKIHVHLNSEMNLLLKIQMYFVNSLIFFLEIDPLVKSLTHII